MKMIRDNPIKSIGLLLILVAISTGVLLIRRNFYGRYSASVVDMALGFTARNLCSCRFVQERSEALCRESSEIDHLSPKLKIDSENVTVTSHFLFWMAKAQYQGPDRGCVLE